MLSKMRFKEFVWPNNPETCQLRLQRKVASHKYPGGGYTLEDLGQEQRVLTGSGAFYGEGAYRTMEALTEVFSQTGAGALYHPVIRFRQAVFTELELTQEPRADFVAYRFTFREDGTGQTSDSAQSAWEGAVYTARGGETLWDVAASYGVTAEALLEKNPNIYNPNALVAGMKVVIW